MLDIPRSVWKMYVSITVCLVSDLALFFAEAPAPVILYLRAEAGKHLSSKHLGNRWKLLLQKHFMQTFALVSGFRGR